MLGGEQGYQSVALAIGIDFKNRRGLLPFQQLVRVSVRWKAQASAALAMVA